MVCWNNMVSTRGINRAGHRTSTEISLEFGRINMLLFHCSNLIWKLSISSNPGTLLTLKAHSEKQLRIPLPEFQIVMFVILLGELGSWTVTFPTYEQCHAVEHMILRINEHNNHGTPKTKVRNIYNTGSTGASIPFLPCEEVWKPKQITRPKLKATRAVSI